MSVTRTYVEMTDRPTAPVPPPPRTDVRVDQVTACPPSFYRYLYAEVGRTYGWKDRSSWTDQTIRSYLADPAISLWVCLAGGAPAGYVEFRADESGGVEIVYFGLLPDFVGAGLGKYFLSAALDLAWSTAPTRVWLHTCTLDHPAALPNYLRRGFRIFKTEVLP